MVLDKSLRAVKRFGSRYGRKIRHKVGRIEAETKKGHKCPYCHAPAVKRVAVGIWNCKKCNSKFTGRAYTIPKKIVIKQEISKEQIIKYVEESKEEKEESEEKEEKKKAPKKKKTEEKKEAEEEAE